MCLKVDSSAAVTKPILAVEANIAFFEMQANEWAKKGAGHFRVDAMHEAIALLKRTDAFLFVAINEDCAPDLMAMLPVMRDITPLPIHVITSTFTIDKKIAATHYGADSYRPYDPKSVLPLPLPAPSRPRWGRQRRVSQPTLVGGDIILSQARRKVYIKSKEIPVTKKEFELLRQVMISGGLI